MSSAITTLFLWMTGSWCASIIERGIEQDWAAVSFQLEQLVSNHSLGISRRRFDGLRNGKLGVESACSSFSFHPTFFLSISEALGPADGKGPLKSPTQPSPWLPLAPDWGYPGCVWPRLRNPQGWASPSRPYPRAAPPSQQCLGTRFNTWCQNNPAGHGIGDNRSEVAVEFIGRDFGFTCSVTAHSKFP